MNKTSTGSASTVKCRCDKCGIEAMSIPNTQHRRCPGGLTESGAEPRPKNKKLPGNQRGEWRYHDYG